MDTEKLIDAIKNIDPDFYVYDIEPHSLKVRDIVQMFTGAALQEFLRIKIAFGVRFYVSVDPITHNLEGIFFEPFGKFF